MQSDRAARFLAGGTLVMRAINEGDTSFSTVVRSTDRGFTEIRPAGARVTLGAGVTMAQVMANGELAFLHPVARSVGGPAIRNMATVGGNLFAPSPYGDFTVALLALDATLSMQGGYSGARDAAGRVSRQSRTQRPAWSRASRSIARTRTRSASGRSSRVKPKGISVLSIAAHLPLSGGRIAGARVAYGAMAPTPMRAKSVERALEGAPLDEAGIASAIAVAAEGTAPPTDALASAWYRREMVAVHLKRLLGGTGGAHERRRSSSATTARDVAVFVDGGASLLTALRDGVGDTSPKFGCGQGTCGVCTVLIDGELHLVLHHARRDRRGPLGRDRGRAEDRRRACTRSRPPSWTTSPRSAASARPAC